MRDKKKKKKSKLFSTSNIKLQSKFILYADIFLQAIL